MRLKSCSGFHMHIERPLPGFFTDPEHLELGAATYIEPLEFMNIGKYVAGRCRGNGCIYEIRLKIRQVA